MSVTEALEQAHGQIKPEAFAANDRAMGSKKSHALPAVYQKQPATSGNKWFAGISGVFILFLLGFVLLNLGPKTASLNSDGNAPTLTPVGSSQAAAQQDTGVPLSADDFLRNR